jgi:hypothetical protein
MRGDLTISTRDPMDCEDRTEQAEDVAQQRSRQLVVEDAMEELAHRW